MVEDQSSTEKTERSQHDLKSTEKPEINDLPDEVLALIFMANTSNDISDPVNPGVHDPYQTTIASILVCRRWYEVAIEYSALWSCIIDYQTHTPQRIERLLALSKSTIFDVGSDSVFKYVRLRDARGRAILGQIFERSSTIRTLSLQITFAPWDFICKQFLQHPAVSLEYLNLITSCPFPDCLFPGQLFADQAPRLRRLHLQRCLIDFSSSVLTNLTELSVMDILGPKIGMMKRPDHPLKVAPTATGWLRILETIPSLRYLTLSNAISPPNDAEDPPPAVNLSCLLLFTIGAKINDSSTVLDHLSIPPACGIRLRLVLNEIGTNTQPLTRLLSFLGARLIHWPDDTRDRYLQAKILIGDRIHFGNSRRVGHIWDMTEEEVITEHSANTADPLLWLVLNFDDPFVTFRFFDDLLSLYQPTYPTTTMLDLWFDQEFVAVNSTLGATTTFPSPHVLGSFTAVKALNLLERSPLHLLPILQHHDQVLFPSLRSLRLTRTNFESEQRTARLMLTFLKWRAHIQAPLAEVQLIESSIDKVTRRELEEKGHVRVVFGTLSSTAEDLDDDP